MKWQEVVLTTTNEAAEAAANIFFEVGVQGVVIEDSNGNNRYLEEGDCRGVSRKAFPRDMVVIKGYLPVDNRLEQRMQLFYEKVAVLEKYFSGYSADITTDEIAEEDWSSSWKKYYKTKKIGERIVIKPRWEDYNAAPGEIVLDIDPGTAFGTGAHPTTIMCLEMLEKYLQKGQVVFDVGCGSGILSVAAAKLGACSVYARDIDPVAVKVARANSVYNGVENRVEVEVGNFLDGVRGRAHIIVANIVADSIIEFSPQAYEKLLPNGVFITSGIINKKSGEVIGELKESGFQILETYTENGWVTVVAHKA